MKIRYILCCLSAFLISGGFAQTTFYHPDTIQKIELYFAQPNWDYQMDTAKAGADGYIIADWVKINGIVFDSVGVKYKGNSSYDETYVKNPLHIELNTVKSQSYQGFKDIKLSNMYSDPSMIREVLAYRILEKYQDAPQANFAQVYINGDLIGLYSNIESINKKFVSEHFNSSDGTFIKCNPTVIPAPNTKSNLKYVSADSSAYFNFYEMKSDPGWNDLVKLCDTVTNFPASLGANLDMDRVIWMLAYNNVLVNLDSYSGVFAQNYYLYKDQTGHYNPIIWDLNMAFGGFPFAGSGNSSLGSLSVANMQQLSATMHSTDPYWPLIKQVMANATYKKMYIAHMKTIADEIFANEAYETMAAALQQQIDTAVQSDGNKFYSYGQFQAGMTADNAVGSYTVPGISNLMDNRNSYLQATTEFMQATPIISNVEASTSNPVLNSTISVSAEVTNVSAVYLGLRFGNLEKFTRIQMFDDGAHQDGTSGDNVYGISFEMSLPQAQYYIYAENSNAGIFSPQRAEHEFFTLQSNIVTAQAGQVVINEFMAVNEETMENEYNEFGDWIELFNTTPSILSLAGLHLSDKASNPTKFVIPQNIVIHPYSTLIVWADEMTTTTEYLHANFKFSADGEQVILSDASGAIMDSISFGPLDADVSMARCPDGTGDFEETEPATFNALNCSLGVGELAEASEIEVYPNPAGKELNIRIGKSAGTNEVMIFNLAGAKIFETNIKTNSFQLDVSSFENGVYILNVNGMNYKVVVYK